MRSIKVSLLAAAVATSLVAVQTQANTINGSVWENFNAASPTGTGSLDGSLANVAIMQGLRSADVTFTVNDPIDFNSAVGGYTIGGFLSSGSATVLSGNSQLGNTADNTLFYFSGMVSMINDQTFTAGHDDGLQLMIGGVDVIDATGPTSFDSTTYTWTGATGNYDFELAYAEVDGPPAVLQISLPLLNTPSVPDSGSTLAMLGGVLTLVGTVGRRFRKVS